MITAPICEFVRRYRYSGALRMHMPGHKGTALLGPEPLDLTEIEGADVLYHAEGIIRESEANAAALFRHQKDGLFRRGLVPVHPRHAVSCAAACPRKSQKARHCGRP